jgi:hypothetical protein
MPPAEIVLGGPICDPMPNGSGSETLAAGLSELDCGGVGGGLGGMGLENGSLTGSVLAGSVVVGIVLAGSVVVGSVLVGRLDVVGVLVGVVLAGAGEGEVKGGALVAVRRRFA